MSRRAAAHIRKRRIPGMEGGLNLTPLLDIIFNLIFFFILATNIEDQNRYLDVTLPESTQGIVDPSNSDIPILTLSQDNTLALNGVEMETEELQKTLEVLVMSGEANTVIFRGDKRSSYQQWVEILEITTSAGVKNLLPQLEQRDE